MMTMADLHFLCCSSLLPCRFYHYYYTFYSYGSETLLQYHTSVGIPVYHYLRFNRRHPTCCKLLDMIALCERADVSSSHRVMVAVRPVWYVVDAGGNKCL